jgi:DNA topoisomerase-3
MWKVIASRRIENDEADELMRTKTIGPLQGFRSRLGRPFAAMLKLKDDFSVELDFGRNSADVRDTAPVDFSAQTSLGACPKCGARVFDHELAYVCEKAAGPARACDFRTGKIILQRPIEPEQVTKLLATGKTDLLHRFISRKGRPFSAFLVRGADGKVGFEFAPRTQRTRRARSSSTASGEPVERAAKAADATSKASPRRASTARKRPATRTRRRSRA